MLKKLMLFSLVVLLSIPLMATTTFADDRITTGGTKDGLRVSTSNTSNVFSEAIPRETGKWYCEIKINSSKSNWQIGVSNTSKKGYERIYYSFGGTSWRRQPVTTNSGWNNLKGQTFSVNQNDIIGIAIDGINNKLEFYKNGTLLISTSFENFDLDSNKFRPQVGTGNSPQGSYDVEFVLDAANFNRPLPESYDPYGEKSQSPEEPATKALKVVLEPQEKLQLSVDDHLNENINMTWTSSDSSVAQVDANGVVTASKAGNAIIHVQSQDGSYSDDINILVVDNADDYRLAVDLTVGKTGRLTVDEVANNLNVTWETSDPSVVTVSSKGVMTAKGKGLALATAKDKDGNLVGQIYIRVREQ